MDILFLVNIGDHIDVVPVEEGKEFCIRFVTIGDYWIYVPSAPTVSLMAD